MLSIARLMRCVGRRRRVSLDERGVSAIEFALIAPLMVALYFGAIELSQGIAIDRKVTLTARTVTDLVAQATKLNQTEMDGLLAAAAAIIAPYPEKVGTTAKLRLTVSQIKIDAQRNATIDWSVTKNGSVRTTVGTLPDAFRVADTYLIWGVAEYDYNPGFASNFVATWHGAVTLRDQIYMRARQQSSVQYTP